jgi:hypothetical protein
MLAELFILGLTKLIMFLIRYSVYFSAKHTRSQTQQLYFLTGFHVESPAVLSIACISNKVNHAFNMTNTDTRPDSSTTRRKAQLLLGIFTVGSSAVITYYTIGCEVGDCQF